MAHGKTYSMRESDTVKGPMELYEIGELVDWAQAAQKAADEHILDDPTYATEETLGNGNDVYQTRVRSGDKRKFYVVRLVGSPYGLLAGCTCQAGLWGNKCKHVARVLIIRGVLDAVEPVSLVDDETRAKMLAVLTTNPYKEVT